MGREGGGWASCILPLSCSTRTYVVCKLRLPAKIAARARVMPVRRPAPSSPRYCNHHWLRTVMQKPPSTSLHADCHLTRQNHMSVHPHPPLSNQQGIHTPLHLPMNVTSSSSLLPNTTTDKLPGSFGSQSMPGMHKISKHARHAQVRDWYGLTKRRGPIWP